MLTAHQEELDRTVALKRIRPDKLHDTARRRFLREAAITARLQHPGIVPIYGLGQDEDGPFYTMPFIEGQTLQEAINAFHGDESLRRDPGPRVLKFRGLLQQFITVCNTMDYAHDQGVIHRDLKPSNIMLGPYGETLVMDWGLAKRLGTDDASGEAEGNEPSPSPSPDALTATGAVLGTPHYMSPEQAKGQAAGPASDIFSLGLVLYAILTGRSPYAEAVLEGGGLHESVREAAVIPPRQRDSGLSRALEAICLKALAARPEDRYPSARALADDLAKWLADESVSAYAEPLLTRVRRWGQRHQRLVTSATAAGLVAAVALVAITTVISIWNRRLETTNQKLASANQTILRNNDQITRQNRELAESNQNLKQARAEAEKERDQAKEVTEFLVSSFRKPDPAAEGEKVTVAQVLGRAVQELEGRKITPATRATILSAVGETYRGLGLVSETVGLFEKVLEIRRRELGEDHPETLESMNNLALACSDAGHPDRAIPLYEQTLAARRAKLGADHLDTLTTLNDLAVAYHDAGQLPRAIPLYQQVLRQRQALQGPDHQETLTSLNNLGTAYQEDGRLDLGIPLLEQALEGQRARLGGDHPETLITLNNLALAYQHDGQFDRAIPLHEQELAASRARLSADHPETLISMNNLATAYLEAGRFDRAIPLLEQTLQAKEKKLGANHPSVLVTLRNLARLRESPASPGRRIALSPGHPDRRDPHAPRRSVLFRYPELPGKLLDPPASGRGSRSRPPRVPDHQGKDPAGRLDHLLRPQPAGRSPGCPGPLRRGGTATLVRTAGLAGVPGEGPGQGSRSDLAGIHRSPGPALRGPGPEGQGRGMAEEARREFAGSGLPGRPVRTVRAWFIQLGYIPINPAVRPLLLGDARPRRLLAVQPVRRRIVSEPPSHQLRADSA